MKIRMDLIKKGPTVFSLEDIVDADPDTDPLTGSLWEHTSIASQSDNVWMLFRRIDRSFGMVCLADGCDFEGDPKATTWSRLEGHVVITGRERTD